MTQNIERDQYVNIFQLPEEMMGCIIGRKGQMIKQLSVKTKCHLRACSAENAIYIYSKSASCIENARTEISNVISTYQQRNRMREKYLSFPEFCWENESSLSVPYPIDAITCLELCPSCSNILQIHFDSNLVEHRHEHAGGIVPVCIDPNTGESFFLFGLNFRNEYCHFHGWIEPRETFEMGCAREGFEESKGVFGSAIRLWRALMDPNFSFRHRSMFVVSLGNMDITERTAMKSLFDETAPTHRGMLEVKTINFIPAIQLRETCLGARYPAAPLEDGYSMREFLLRRQAWLNDASFWSRCEITSIIDRGEWPQIGSSDGGGALRSLAELDQISEHEEELLQVIISAQLRKK